MEQRVLMSSRGISRHRKTNKVHKNHVNIDVFVEKDKNDKEGMGDIEPMEPKERVHQKANLEGNLQHLDNVNEKEAMMKDKQVVGARGKGRDIICKVSQTTRPWVFLEEPFAVEEKPPKYENNSKHKKIIEEDLKGMKGDKKLDHHHQAIEAKGDPILDIFGNENTDKDQTFQDQGQQQEQLDGEQIVQVQKKKKKKGIQKERQNRHQHNLQHQQGQDRLDPGAVPPAPTSNGRPPEHTTSGSQPGAETKAGAPGYGTVPMF
ncbi:hypothetical protein BGX34_009547 [Mortierella sp. NVP85]|nr:hypothetical protein BGX34_009547 [Mortierella sp. NVP85]